MHKSILCLGNGLAVYLGNLQQTKTHAHHAIQIIVSMEGAMHLKIDDNEWGEYRALILSSNGTHECIVANTKKIIINLEPQSTIALKIKNKYLSKNKYYILSWENVSPFMNTLKTLSDGKNHSDFILKETRNFLQSLVPEEVKITPIDSRIQNILNILKTSIDIKQTLSELAKQAFLSEGRLTHLFKLQVGIPIRRYLLWVRINKAVEHIANGQTLTDAALNAGFSDSAHFTRTFGKMFGMNPSFIFKNSQNIQAFVCNT